VAVLKDTNKLKIILILSVPIVLIFAWLDVKIIGGDLTDYFMVCFFEYFFFLSGIVGGYYYEKIQKQKLTT
jgi:hypothetical protein